VSDGYQNGDLDAAPSAPNSDWDVASIQPEPGLPHDGFFEAFAKTDNADLKNWFSLSFIWRGIGQPGSQAYDIIDTDLSIITSGNTVPYNPNPSVPEPAVWLLLLTGLIYFGRQFYRYKHSVPLFGKEWLGKILFNKSLSIPLFQRGEVTAYLAIESEE
jgi:hypothetical protein